MIHNVIPVIANELNNYLASEFDFDEAKVLVSNIVNQDGAVAFEGTNKLLCTLVNIEEEKLQAGGMNYKRIGSKIGMVNPPVRISLKLLFSAHFTGKNYVEALKIISYVVRFFQRKSVFTRNNTPRLSENVDQLTFELMTLEMNEISHLWGMMGAKYMPSVLYKVQMLSFDDSLVKEEVPEFTTIELETSMR
ncbi:MAG: DUF4255 domain-containing protein [Cytophagales bacterium]|nr:DUF4255 domain-containing protein [Cytophagales bacterium]